MTHPCFDMMLTISGSQHLWVWVPEKLGTMRISTIVAGDK